MGPSHAPLPISARFQPAILNLMIPASVFGQDVEYLRGVHSPNFAASDQKHRQRLCPSRQRFQRIVRFPSSTSCFKRAISVPVHLIQELVLFFFTCGPP